MVEFITIVIYTSIYVGLVATTFYIISFWMDKRRKKPMFKDGELPFVSVIIPAYNEEKSIGKTIATITKSNYPKNKFEVIVVDDGSKDDTLKIAKQFASTSNPVIKVFHKENEGKGAALNFGLTKAKGEIFISMDADTRVSPKSMKNMVRYFKDENIMAVTPAMVVENPKTIWQRIQHVEYLTGLFLRKAFASVNAIYITPGAFSAYRKSFTDKYGGYDVGNITEDLELSLKIQYNGYAIENCPTAPAYTTPPSTFKKLLIQRRRWYFGLIRNTLKYRKIMSKNYGDLGMFVMPVAWMSIFFAVFVTVYLFIKSIFDVKEEILFLQSINFDFVNSFNLSFYVVERFLFLFFSKPVVLFVLLFVIILGVYLYYASRKVDKTSNLIINLPLFFIFFAVLFGLWWIVSIIYAIFVKQVKWR